MRNITWSSSLVLGLLVIAGASSALASETEQISRTLPLGASGLVKIRNFSGHVTVTATEGHDVVVEAVRRGSRSQLDASHFEARAEGGAIVVEANARPAVRSWFSWGNHSLPDVDLDVKVPREARLDVSVFSSPIAVRGVAGDCRLHTFSAGVKAEDVTGAITAHTFSGGVSIASRDEAGKAITVDTFSGNVDLRVPVTARGTVQFRSFSGQFDSDRPVVVRERNRRTMTAELGDATGASARSDVHLKTFSGNVHIM